MNVVLPENWTKNSGVDGVFVPRGYNADTAPAAVRFMFMGKLDKNMSIEFFALSSSMALVRDNPGSSFEQLDWNIVREGYSIIVHKLDGVGVGLYRAYIAGPDNIYACIDLILKSDDKGSNEYIDAFKVCLERLALMDIESIKN
jgi:hypothetical protein